MPRKIWFDTDIAIGQWDARTAYADVDDAFALIQCIASTAVEVVGISTVFGNTDVLSATRIAQRVVSDFGPKGGIPVFQGAESPLALSSIQPSAATDGLRRALENSPEGLDILAIGPATNIATLLACYPDLHTRIKSVTLVAGRRGPDQHFTVGPKHSPPFPDLNFDLDPNAFSMLLQSGLEVILLPFEISHKVWVSSADLDALHELHAAGGWLADGSRAWLQQWEAFGRQAFNPFDLLASAWLINPDGFIGETLPAQLQIHPDDRQSPEGPLAFKPYLCCAPDIVSPYQVRYIHTPPENFLQRCWKDIADWKPDH